MRIQDLDFRRKFSCNLYKDLRLKLAQMTFTSDFVTTPHGDLYPVLEAAGEYTEVTGNGEYMFSGKQAHLVRFFGQHFPYATYAVELSQLRGEAGIRIANEQTQAAIVLTEAMEVALLQGDERQAVPTGLEFAPGVELTVTFRVQVADVYIRKDGKFRYITSFDLPGFENMDHQRVFSATAAGLYVSGDVTVGGVSACVDCGIAQADIRPICYESGEIMVEAGKVYLTASIRMHQEKYQGVFSWVPGTCEFALTGALFYDAGDGLWGNDVAASVKFHRPSGKWLLWVCSFTHDHVLGWCEMAGDPRFGLNVVDITLMPTGSEDTEFVGIPGDEDPDFIYDESKDRWLMTICRMDPQIKAYRYYLFESQSPFDRYRFVGKTAGQQETGGSLLRVEGEYYFVCGANFKAKSEYHVYSLQELSRFDTLLCDYPDGGFRGWGTVMCIPVGSRERWFWLTFDRYRAGDYTWSYGNIYCFEGMWL